MPRRSLRMTALTTVPAPRNPPGVRVSNIRGAGRSAIPGTGLMEQTAPYGAVPGGLKARFPNMTLPEWAVWWGLLKNGKQADVDFIYQDVLMGIGISYYSTVDFMLPQEHVAFEVQGTYWHYMDSDRIYRDRERLSHLAAQGIYLIFIDEEDALTKPVWIVAEALQMRDHSMLAKRLA